MISISRTKGRLMRIGDGGAVGGQDGIASCLGRGLGSSSDWREPNSPVKENDERRYHPGDNEHKQEIAPSLLRAAAVIVDDLEQCAKIGDLHHALSLGVMQRKDVRASLDQVVAGLSAGRVNDQEIVIFDSTGVAIEDVAAAALVYERAEETGVGTVIGKESAEH